MFTSRTEAHANATTAYSETYKGRAILVTLVPAWAEDRETVRFASAQGEHLEVSLDGRSFSCPSGTADVVAKKVRAMIDLEEKDAALLPELLKVVDARTTAEGLVEVSAELGGLAYVHAMNRLRLGIITKVGRKNVEVAYTTASSGGRVFRKATPVQGLLGPAS